MGAELDCKCLKREYLKICQELHRVLEVQWSNSGSFPQKSARHNKNSHMTQMVVRIIAQHMYTMHNHYTQIYTTETLWHNTHTHNIIYTRTVVILASKIVLLSFQNKHSTLSLIAIGLTILYHTLWQITPKLVCLALYAGSGERLWSNFEMS